MFELVNQFIESNAGNPLVLLILFLCCTIDGFFPPIPSESLVVGLSAIGASTGMPPWWGIIVASALGAWCGDNLAYLIGRRIGTRWLTRRFPKVAKGLAWAERQLERRGAMIIIVARYIPVGRVAVNLTSGASGLPQRRFMLLTVVSALTWSGYSVGLGTVAGHWLHDNPLLAAAIGIVMALVLGVAVDQVLQRIFPARDPEVAAQEAVAAADPDRELWPDGDR